MTPGETNEALHRAVVTAAEHEMEYYLVQCQHSRAHIFQLPAWRFEDTPAGPVLCPACEEVRKRNAPGSHWPIELRNP
jgi:hypothetical protein